MTANNNLSSSSFHSTTLKLLYLCLICVVTGITRGSIVCRQLGYSEVRISSGAIRGRLQKCDIAFKYKNPPNITNIEEFLGIPYATPPIGHLRFQKTKPIEPWTDTVARDTLSHGARCTQRWSGERRDQGYSAISTSGDDRMSEDCLFANVYAPQRTQGVKYPIMVFIHGGSYVYGTGNRYNGTSLAHMGSVVITFNYRLGALGFLTSGDSRLPGNYGLFDQLELLKWVQRNAHAFGGDKNSVTIFGSSAGAASVGIMYLSPLTTGLFHKAIAQSGSANAMWATHQSQRSFQGQVRDLANATFCLKDKKQSFDEDLNCIMGKKAAWFEEDTICKRMKCELIDPAFKPVIDGDIIVSDIRSLLKKGLFPKDIPFMTGTVKTEFGINMRKKLSGMPAGLDAYLRDNYDTVSRDMIAYEYSNWSSSEAQNGITFADENYDRSETLSDLGLVAPTAEFVQHLVSADDARHNADVYLYYLERDDESYHSLDLNDVFGAGFLGDNRTFDELDKPRQYADIDLSRSEQLMRIWVNFANLGRPLKNREIWPAVTKKHLNYLNFRTTNAKTILHVKRDYYSKKAYFWSRLLTHRLSSTLPTEVNTPFARSERSDRDRRRSDRQEVLYLLVVLALICLTGSLVLSGFWNVSLWRRTRRYDLAYEQRIYI